MLGSEQRLCERVDMSWRFLVHNHSRTSPRAVLNPVVVLGVNVNTWTGRLRQPPGSAVSPRTCSPQHWTEPSVLTPQVWPKPALTEVNSPVGGVASPSSLEPQHSTEPSVLTPQVCQDPALTEVNSPADLVFGAAAVAVAAGVAVAVGRAAGVGVTASGAATVTVAAGVAVAVGGAARVGVAAFGAAAVAVAAGVVVAVGRPAGVGVAASGAAVFVTADVGACVGSGLTPCPDEAVVVLESVPFEGAGSGSSEHPVSRMASTAAVTSSLMIDFDIAFTSLTSLT